jgi:hypothetical protein
MGTAPIITAQLIRVPLEVHGRETHLIRVSDLDEVEVPIVRLLVDAKERGRSWVVDIARACLPEELQGAQHLAVRHGRNDGL